MRQRAMLRFCDLTSTGLPREPEDYAPGRERLWSTAHAIINPCPRTAIRQHSRRRPRAQSPTSTSRPSRATATVRSKPSRRADGERGGSPSLPCASWLPRGNAGAAAQMQDGCGRNTHSHLNTAVSQALQCRAKEQALFDVHDDVNRHLVATHDKGHHGVQHLADFVTGKGCGNRR